MKRNKDALMAFINKNNLDALKDVALFIIITLIIHYAWRFWANQLHYVPIRDFMRSSQEWMANGVFNQSVWLIQHLLGIEITTNYETNHMQFLNDGYMSINNSCSGLKQIMQFVILMMVFPGPWKRKLWFIPMGIVVVHLTNLFRITGLSVVITTIPDYWKFCHDYIFRPIFYVMIFSMWVWWVERVSKTKKDEPEPVVQKSGVD